MADDKRKTIHLDFSSEKDRALYRQISDRADNNRRTILQETKLLIESGLKQEAKA